MVDFIGIYENAASQDYCDRMIAKFHALHGSGEHDFSQVNYGGVSKRKDKVSFFNKAAIGLANETHRYLDAALRDYKSKHVGLDMLEISSRTVKVQETPPGGGYHLWHNEKGGTDFGRRLTWIIYLNTLPEGEGETELIEQGLRIRPEAGKIILFPADWTHTHRGNPPYTENKYIATGWYTDN